MFLLEHKKFLLWVIVFFFGGCHSAIRELSEIEPNDATRIAQKIGALTILTGSIASAKDEDFFELKLKRDEVVQLRFAVEKGAGVYAVSLLDERKKEISSFRTKKKKTGPWMIHPNLGSKVFVRVRSRDSFHPTKYFMVLLKARATFNEAEPNDSLNRASTLVNNGIVQGTLSPKAMHLERKDSEVDWYRLVHKSIDGKPIAVSAYVTPLANVDLSLEIFDVRGRQIMFVDNFGEGEHEEFFQIRLEKPHELFLKLTGKGVFTKRFLSYEINTEVAPLQPNSSYEPNDSLGQAVLFAEEIEEIRGRVDNSQDLDVYKIKINQIDGALLNLILYPGKNQDLDLEILDRLGKLVASSAIKGREEIESIVNLLVYQETLYARVTPRRNSPMGEYVLKRYYRPYLEGLEKEPNDDPSRSTSMVMEKLYSGYLSQHSDVDYFSFNVYEAWNYQLEVMGAPNTLYFVEVLDSEGKTLEQAENDESRLSLSMALSRGTYFIKIGLLGESEINSDEVYRLKLSQ